MNTIQTFNHLLFPSHTNNFRAKLLHSHIMLFIAVAVVAFQLILRLLSSPQVAVLGYAANISPQKVVELTNEARARVGANPLAFSDVLSEAARKKGLDMLAKDYWAHTAPDGTEPWDFFHSAGYSYRYAGENLARDFENPSDAIAAWLASPSHKENLLSAKYNEIGIAVVEGDLDGKDTTLIVQFFGTLSSTSPTVPLAEAQEISVEEDLIAEPEEAPRAEVAVAQAQAATSAAPVLPVSSFSTMRVLTIGIIGLTGALLVFDIIILKKRGVTRPGGRAFAHLSFMAMVIVILVLIRAGEII